MRRFVTVMVIATIGIALLGAGRERTTVQADTDSAAAGAGCLQGPVTPLANTGIEGNSILCMDPAGVHVDMAVQNLTPGNVYTMWFVYFDRPSACQTGPCGAADALGDDPVGTFGRMDGVVADASGMTTFSGNFRNLHLSSGSQVWLLMFGHGAASMMDNRELARQLLTPQKPSLGAPGLGAPSDSTTGSGVAQTYIDIP